MNTRTARRPFLKRPIILSVLGVVAVAIAVAAFWLEPWKLVVDQTVDEALPTVSQTDGRPSAEPVVLAAGSFISHEHTTTGSVELLELSDGTRVLRIENLDTSNGPLLKVFLTDAPVVDGTAGWRVFDDGRYEDLGELKGNIGSSNYVVPADVDIDGLTSVSIWCDRFDVSFGAATLG
ncbi:DM13 domain-containing protein [Antrihabitans sp. YC3-6]|uniref:DM13 domain-containing protein n=1 Tax=Antrihabitans stalagmiti TaxID=2799499 RepID=A0A934NQ80_9NOCA|nr:DM13 domain-containing protein [Antrihabitans stalagmiti]MBJ8339338.1 DM13 domain-containing protein [Antrihabitans stalagmiti]